MSDQLSASAQKVQDALSALGFGTRQVVELPDSTRTAAEAAAAIGCTVPQIAKYFGGAEKLRTAVSKLQTLLYAA